MRIGTKAQIVQIIISLEAQCFFLAFINESTPTIEKRGRYPPIEAHLPKAPLKRLGLAGTSEGIKKDCIILAILAVVGVGDSINFSGTLDTGWIGGLVLLALIIVSVTMMGLKKEPQKDAVSKSKKGKK